MCLYLEIDIITGKIKVRSCSEWTVNLMRMTFLETDQDTHKDKTKKAGDDGGRDGCYATTGQGIPGTRRAVEVGCRSTTDVQ